MTIAWEVGDARRLVGDTGTVVPPRDPRLLAEGILGQLERIAAQPSLGVTAREKALAEHSVARSVDAFRTAIASIA